MPVLMFRPRFVDPILAGTKRQTIRRPRKRPIRPGDELSLRAWTGRPYASPQRVLCVAPCEAVLAVEIRWEGIPGGLAIRLGDEWLSLGRSHRFAQADGFKSADDMLTFWREVNGLTLGGPPFVGTVIEWRRERAR